MKDTVNATTPAATPEFIGGADPIEVSDAEVADEIRVIQSVQIMNYTPAQLFGNLYPVLAVAYITWPAPILSGAVWAYFALFVLLIPMTTSYFRLRNRPRPRAVSRRRIRAIVFSSALLGSAWAASVVLLTPYLQIADAIALFTVSFILICGSVAMLPSLPKAAVAYLIPIVIATLYSSAVSGLLSVPWLSLALLGVLGSVSLAMWQNWHDLKRSVRLRLENTKAQRVTEESRRALERVSGQLAKYISPQLYSAILEGKQEVEIASQRKKLTIFFSDIAGFTDLTDQLQPEEITTLLNQYLTEMLEIAKEHGAYFDKFIGDAIVLYFGDPVSLGVKQDAEACVRMAIAMQRRMRELQSDWRAMGVEKPFEIRIGINTGYCTVGNFGSPDRMDYTIIGAEVNLASRLEYEAETGGILLANETYSLVKEWVMAEQAESLNVQGFSRPIRTYRVKGIYDDLSAQGRIIHRREDGLRLTIDTERMDGEGRARAQRALEEALDALRNGN
ncbi:MAG: adenylate/guanylate cyclase domain-containing protein [Xanthomonadales bacterium]|nr:adenylate/guanylate cyclase domain-containing protein [Xanthomonadales bacterium]